jgi:hypothetical protein
MAEIKSTLDLIMEKTRGLTMTEEEKRELREKNLVGKVRGLVQKYLDGALDMDRFREKAAALAGEAATDFSRILTKEVLSRIEPESDNGPLFAVIEQELETDTVRIRKRLERFEHKLEEKRAAHEKDLRKMLKKRGISGSAVIPNLGADKDWLQLVARMRGEFKEDIYSISDC